MKGTVSPKSSDQPKVSARDLKTMDAPANLQYRAWGLKHLISAALQQGKQGGSMSGRKYGKKSRKTRR